MQTITLGKTRYIISDARIDILAAHAACTGKHKRVKSKGADLRRFPAYWDGMSTADYVARYYEINSNRREFPSGKGAPYGHETTLAGFYEGLNNNPAAQYTSADSFEVQA